MARVQGCRLACRLWRGPMRRRRCWGLRRLWMRRLDIVRRRWRWDDCWRSVRIGFVVSHPNDKNKNVARVGHPWIGGLPPLREKKLARMGHGRGCAGLALWIEFDLWGILRF